MTDHRTMIVDQNNHGGRLDLALSALLPELSRTALARLVRDGMVSLDGVVVTKPAQIVEEGMSIGIEIPPPVDQSVIAQDLPLEIVYQDGDIAVVNKPAGLVVHPAAGHRDGTLVNALLHHLNDLSGIGGELRPGIVHRLDRDTSGLIVIAKNDLAHRTLAAAWGSSDVVKEYLALVYGSPRGASGTIDAPVGRDPGNRKRMAIVRGGRRAITHWSSEDRLRYVSLLRCRLETGRTHQIRVHLKSIGHPVVGDSVYGGAQWKGIPDHKLQHAIRDLHRQALHASRLAFPHPRTGAPMNFESELPLELRKIIEIARI